MITYGAAAPRSARGSSGRYGLCNRLSVLYFPFSETTPISFHRRGEIRDRSAEGQHYRIAGMNLLAAIIIFWNTMKLGEVVANQKRDGKLLSPDLLAHVSPLGWEHINLTGEYRWPKP